MFTPFFCHWYPSGAIPVATTVNVAVCPAVTVWLAGWVVIEGAAGDPLLVPATYPPHPSFTIPIVRSNPNKTTPRRFMITSLLQNVFPGARLLGMEKCN